MTTSGHTTLKSWAQNIEIDNFLDVLYVGLFRRRIALGPLTVNR